MLRAPPGGGYLWPGGGERCRVRAAAGAFPSRPVSSLRRDLGAALPSLGRTGGCPRRRWVPPLPPVRVARRPPQRGRWAGRGARPAVNGPGAGGGGSEWRQRRCRQGRGRRGGVRVAAGGSRRRAEVLRASRPVWALAGGPGRPRPALGHRRGRCRRRSRVVFESPTGAGPLTKAVAPSLASPVTPREREANWAPFPSLPKKHRLRFFST